MQEHLTPKFIDQAKIRERFFKETYREFNKQNSAHSIINSLHWDKIGLHEILKIVDEFCKVEWDHHLLKTAKRDRMCKTSVSSGNFDLRKNYWGEENVGN